MHEISRSMWLNLFDTWAEPILSPYSSFRISTAVLHLHLF